MTSKTLELELGVKAVRNKSSSNLHGRVKRNKSSNSLSSHGVGSHAHSSGVQFVGSKKKRSDSSSSEGRVGRRKGGFDFGFTALPTEGNLIDSRGRNSSRSRSRTRQSHSPKRLTPPQSITTTHSPISTHDPLQPSSQSTITDLQFPKLPITNNQPTPQNTQLNSFGLELGLEGTKRASTRPTFSTGVEDQEINDNLIGSFIPDPPPSLLLSPAQQYQSLHSQTDQKPPQQTFQLNPVPTNSPATTLDSKLSDIPFPTSTILVSPIVPPFPPRNQRKHSNASMLSLRSNRSTNSISFGGLMGPPTIPSTTHSIPRRSVPTKIDTTSSTGSFESRPALNSRRTNSVGSLKALVEESSAIRALEKFKTKRITSSSSLGGNYFNSLRELAAGGGSSSGSSARGSPLSSNFVKPSGRESVIGYFDSVEGSKTNGSNLRESSSSNNNGAVGGGGQKKLLISRFIEPSHLSLASPAAANKALPSHVHHPTVNNPSRLRNISPELEEEIELEQGKGERVASMKKWALGLVKEAERIQAGYESGGKWRDLMGEVLGRVGV